MNAKVKEMIEFLREFTKDETQSIKYDTARQIEAKFLSLFGSEAFPANIDWEKVIGEIKNPYPESAYIPRSKEEWEEYHKVLEDNGMCGTGFSGCVGRDVWEACKHTIIEALKKEMKEAIK